MDARERKKNGNLLGGESSSRPCGSETEAGSGETILVSIDVVVVTILNRATLGSTDLCSCNPNQSRE